MPDSSIAQEEMTAPEILGTETGPSIGNFWDLTKHAGGFRWLIFGVLVVGVFLISMKIYELILDKRRAERLESADIKKLNEEQIVKLLSQQSDNLLSRLMATLINVFHTSKNAQSLHDEIANYVQFQHDRFSTFRTRIDFLADTAGALGLLGTVWGMFIVFFSGDLDRQVILTGMGIALLTTLLGLVVSIFLNFFSTVASGIYNKRLNQVIQKSDELRFRLLEFTGESVAAVPPVPSLESIADKKNDNEMKRPTIDKNFVEERQKKEDVVYDPPAQHKPEQVVETKPVPEVIDIESKLGEYQVGEVVKNIGMKITDKNSKPVSGTEITLRIRDGGGIINNNGKAEKVKTDKDGFIRFNWTLGEIAGEHVVEAVVHSGNGKELKREIPVSVKPGPPHTVKMKGNNQVGLAGKQLPKPLIVELYDEYENAVSDCEVQFQVTMGNGTLTGDKKSATLKTDKNGAAKVPYTLDPEPGFNAVTATVKGKKTPVKFQAMGQEDNG